MTIATSTKHERNPAVAKWKDAISPDYGLAGFMVLPDALFRKQADLEIDSTELIVLLNILLHWWKEDNLPYPSSTSIAKRMGVSKRTVERSIKSLCGKGLLKKLARELVNERTVRRYDPSGLIRRITD